jgi:hypothetical protein
MIAQLFIAKDKMQNCESSMKTLISLIIIIKAMKAGCLPDDEIAPWKVRAAHS